MYITLQILSNLKSAFRTKDLVSSYTFGELLILIQEKL